MDTFARSVIPVRIEDEMRSSYMDYSMSVIVGRALPDVRDGLKPVHRRILFAMHQEGLLASRKYSKCAGVVGEVLKKYHPHGDSAVYDALVRMAQPWNLRYLLVDGQGNFGSVDGDPAAAYRYTECKLTRIAEEMLTDIDKETVGFTANFDGTVEEPTVLPSRLPNLLVNGADGIAVGMATKIPPHNLGEVIDACLMLIDQPDSTLDDVMTVLPAPDFPTGATIFGRKGVRDAYETGRGRILVRGNATFETLEGGRRAIVIDQIPYQVNKARLVEQIAELVMEKRIEGIHALRDESDRTGMRVVVELKRDAFDEVVLNHLYKHTPLQSTFGVILLAIVNEQPRVLTLIEMLQHYIAHRREVVLRRTRYELRKARERAHVLEGYRIALDNLDEVIALIRASRSVAEAREGLVSRFALSVAQAVAILELRLQRLTAMEMDKIQEEYDGLLVRITELEAILASEERLMQVVKDELLEVRGAYADARRTVIVDSRGELSIHDLVPEEDQVVTLSHRGYIKRCSPDEWRMQRRGGVGTKGMATRDEDFVTSIFVANTHDKLLVFTRSGKVFPLDVYEVPESGRTTKGRPLVQLLEDLKDEHVAAVVSVKELRSEDESGPDLLFVSKEGLVKRMALSQLRNLRTGGMIAAGVADGDELLLVRTIDEPTSHAMLFTQHGQCIRFDLSEVPEFGRAARGNRGIRLEGDDVVVDAILVPVAEGYLAEDVGLDDDEVEDVPGPELIDEEEDEPEEAWPTTLLTVTTLGFGKRCPFPQYRPQRRYGKGIMSLRTSDVTGPVVGAVEVSPEAQLMLVTDTGRVIRIEARSVRLVMSRAARGVRLMRLEPGERIVDITRLAERDEEEAENTGLDEGTPAEESEVSASSEPQGLPSDPEAE